MGDKTFTTLCYLEKDDSYLLMHRTKKENDINKDKYIGVGGHIEHGESPEECISREISEETGLVAKNIKLRGLITFVIDNMDEYSFLYTCHEFSGNMTDCNEGELVWVKKNEIHRLPIWEGDKIFFKLLETRKDFFSLKLTYIDDELVAAVLDGEPIEY